MKGQQHRPIRFERQRDYPMSTAEAWRLLADTNHLNRSVGLPSIEYSPMGGDAERTLLRARAKVLGVVPVRWTEYPFDWVRERRYAVRRQFDGGPVACLVGGVELHPSGSGVNVRVFAEFTPANLAGRFLWRLGTRAVHDFLAYCDQYLSRKAAGKADPIPVPPHRPSVDRGQLDRVMARLEQAPVQRELLEPLRDRIEEGSDDQLVGVRAFAVADAWGADRLEVLRLFLHATRAGLFALRWDLMCPNCRVTKAESATLRELPQRYHCEVCGISYTADFDQRVELRFSVHPAIRRASDAVYCTGGPLRMPHIVAQQYLQPGEDRRLDIELDQPLRLRTVGAEGQLIVVPDPRSGRSQDVTLTYAAGRWVGPHSMATASDDTLLVPCEATPRLRNQTGGPLLVVLEEIEPAGQGTTAAQATTLQELLAPGQQLAVQDIALLFSDLRGSTSLYEGVGDAAAYSRVNRHFDFIKERVARHSGAIVKTMGDGLMGAFQRLDDALAAAVSMQQDVGAWCASQQIDPPLVLKIGVHHGPVIAMTANERLDYFGRTANLAARLGAESRGGDVVLLKETFEEAAPPLASGGQRPMTVETFRARLRGLEGDRELVRIQVPAADAAEPVLSGA